jgi:hypothetical protein
MLGLLSPWQIWTICVKILVIATWKVYILYKAFLEHVLTYQIYAKSVHTERCYISVEEWKKLKKLKSLGMPQYLGSGSHECNGLKYRFVVMDRYGKDLWSLFLENKRVFMLPTVLRVGLQIVSIKHLFSTWDISGWCHGNCDVYMWHKTI